MTVSELYNSVAQLGFEDSLEDDGRFFFAANRALLQVNSIRPATSVYVINHKPMENKASCRSFIPLDKTEDLFFEATDVKSYFFEADGNGTAYVELLNTETGDWVKIGMQEFSGTQAFTAYKGFIKQDGHFVHGTVRLHFTGEYLYSVKCVAMYSYLYSDDPSDIPAYEAHTRYDISSLVPDFLSLDVPPIREADYGYMSQGYDVENGRTILLPYDAKGLYKIKYQRMPRQLQNMGDAHEDTTVIDLDEDLCALLPLLIASYVWAEDEAEKAEYYLSLYRERATDIERRILSTKPATIRNKNGW